MACFSGLKQWLEELSQAAEKGKKEGLQARREVLRILQTGLATPGQARGARDSPDLRSQGGRGASGRGAGPAAEALQPISHLQEPGGSLAQTEYYDIFSDSDNEQALGHYDSFSDSDTEEAPAALTASWASCQATSDPTSIVWSRAWKLTVKLQTVVMYKQPTLMDIRMQRAKVLLTWLDKDLCFGRLWKVEPDCTIRFLAPGAVNQELAICDRRDHVALSSGHAWKLQQCVSKTPGHLLDFETAGAGPMGMDISMHVMAPCNKPDFAFVTDLSLTKDIGNHSEAQAAILPGRRAPFPHGLGHAMHAWPLH